MRRARPWVLLCTIGAIGLVWRLAEDRAVTEEPSGASPQPVIPDRTAALSPSSGVKTLPASRGGQDLIGTRMPMLEFDRVITKPNDETQALTLYRWWTDRCPFCQASLPAIEALREKYEPRGLKVVAVYHPKPSRSVSDTLIRNAARRYGYAGSIAVDADWSELQRFYLDTGRRRATSASFLVDRDGVIRFVHPGPDFYPSSDSRRAQQDRDYRLLSEAIEALLPPRSGPG